MNVVGSRSVFKLCEIGTHDLDLGTRSLPLCVRFMHNVTCSFPFLSEKVFD